MEWALEGLRLERSGKSEWDTGSQARSPGPSTHITAGPFAQLWSRDPLLFTAPPRCLLTEHLILTVRQAKRDAYLLRLLLGKAKWGDESENAFQIVGTQYILKI